MSKTAKRKTQAIRPFDQTLREINGGRLVAELTDELTEVISAVVASGKAGSISLTLKLKPRGPSNKQIELIPAVKGTKPEANRPIAIFFVNNDHGLQREDPSQLPLAGLSQVPDKGVMSNE